jgi:hypothetical protein
VNNRKPSQQQAANGQFTDEEGQGIKRQNSYVYSRKDLDGNIKPPSINQRTSSIPKPQASQKK